MNVPDIRSALRQFVLENYLFTDDSAALNDKDSFLDNGILDSMGILELVDFLDASLGVKVEGDELMPENLDSIEQLVTFVQGKQKT